MKTVPFLQTKIKNTDNRFVCVVLFLCMYEFVYGRVDACTCTSECSLCLHSLPLSGHQSPIRIFLSPHPPSSSGSTAVQPLPISWVTAARITLLKIKPLLLHRLAEAPVVSRGSPSAPTLAAADDRWQQADGETGNEGRPPSVPLTRASRGTREALHALD